MTTQPSLIEVLWDRHYAPGTTGSYHGDMADAFAKMLADEMCSLTVAKVLRRSIQAHMQVERSGSYQGRRFFCERWAH